MPDSESGRIYIVHQLQVAGTVSTKVAGNHLLLSVTGRGVRCRSGSEISGAGLHERQGAERWSRGVEGCGIRDDESVTDEVLMAASRLRKSGELSYSESPQICQFCTVQIPPPGTIDTATQFVVRIEFIALSKASVYSKPMTFLRSIPCRS